MEQVKENIVVVTPDNFQAEVLECEKPVLAGNLLCELGPALPHAAAGAGFHCGQAS